MIQIKIKKSQVFDKISHKISTYNKTIYLGFFSTAVYKDGTPATTVARANNYGTVASGGRIPPRPFLTTLPAYKKKAWAEYLGKVFNNGIETTGDVIQALETAQHALAEQAKNDLQDAIISWDSPPNAPATIQKKGSSNPLIDTGFLKSAATYQIR